jgi:hypothetical protein
LKEHALSLNIFPFLGALAHRLPVLEDEDKRLYHKNMKIISPNYLAQAWTAGARPTAVQLQQWSPLEVLVFLQHLPRELDHASLAWLDAQLHLTDRGNYEIVVEWLTIAAGSDYEPVFGRIREVLTQVGRMKFLRPLFVALGKHARTQQLGREIYDTAQATYHSLSRRVIAAVMAQWTTP